MRFHFYTAIPCELCDKAMAIIASSRPDILVSLTKYDVKADHHLFHVYGARIPVLKDTLSGKELFWPFDKNTLEEFLR